MLVRDQYQRKTSKELKDNLDILEKITAMAKITYKVNNHLNFQESPIA
jgi:hypothetical protein